MFEREKHFYEFGPFCLDAGERMLLRDGKTVPLPPKAFETLLALVEHSGHVLDKNELMEKVWPNTFVEEANLSQHIFVLRKALGEDQQYIETMPRRGYCFVASVKEWRGAVKIEERAGRIKSVGLIVSITLLVITAVVFGLYRMRNRNQTNASAPFHTPFHTMEISRLTGAGNYSHPAFSPDGKYIAYVLDTAGQYALWLRQVATNSQAQIVPPSYERYQGVTFSRDGNWIYFVRDTVLYHIPALGGNARKLLENVDSEVTLSPDGARLAFVRENSSQREVSIIVASADDGGEKKLITRRLPEYFRSVDWSPDGRVIAAAAGTRDGRSDMTVVGVGVESGREIPITAEQWEFVGRPAWFSDGSGLVAPAVNDASGLSQLWQIFYPGGETRRLTNDLNNYRGVSLTADSGRLVTIQRRLFLNLWTVPNGEADRATQLTSGIDQANRPCWTPDGRIVYESWESGKRDIWIIEADGGGKRQLTLDSHLNYQPSVSHDGRYIVYVSERDGTANLWRMEIDGAHPVRLTSGVQDADPYCSPQGGWVVYAGRDSGKTSLWKVSIDGGAPAPLTDKLSKDPVVSPDGKWVACYYWNERLDSPTQIAVIPLAGGSPVKIFDIPPPILFPAIVRWTPDGNALTYLDHRGGVSNIWRQPLDGGAPKRVTDFKTDRIFHFDWSRDFKRLVCARGAATSDVVLIERFR